MKPFDKVIGYQKVKDELNQILDMIQNPAIYEEMGANLPRGILFYGEPAWAKRFLPLRLSKHRDHPFIPLRKIKTSKAL